MKWIMNTWLRITINVIGIDVIGIYQDDEGTIVNLNTMTNSLHLKKIIAKFECIECNGQC